MAANESIPLFKEGPISVLATAAITGKTFVSVSATIDATTGLIKAATTAAAAKALGVAAYDIASGAQGLVHTSPGVITPVTTDATGVTAGDEIEVATGGLAKTFSAGIKVGQAMETKGASTDVLVKLY